MECVAPLGPVYQAGTLAGNPIAMAAGVATLETLRSPGTYEALEEMSARLEGELRAAAAEAGVPVTMNRVGSLFCLFFAEGPVEDFASVREADAGCFTRYFHAMLDEGINLAPSPFEAGFERVATNRTAGDAKAGEVFEAEGGPEDFRGIPVRVRTRGWQESPPVLPVEGLAPFRWPEPGAGGIRRCDGRVVAPVRRGPVQARRHL